MSARSTKRLGADRAQVSPGPFDVRPDRPIPGPIVLIGASLVAATAASAVVLADTVTGGAIGSGLAATVAAVLRWPAIAAVVFTGTVLVADRLFRTRQRDPLVAAGAPAATRLPGAGAPDCHRCNGRGRVLECPLWPQCGCPDGSVWSGCAGIVRACPICRDEGSL